MSTVGKLCAMLRFATLCYALSMSFSFEVEMEVKRIRLNFCVEGKEVGLFLGLSELLLFVVGD